MGSWLIIFGLWLIALAEIGKHGGWRLAVSYVTLGIGLCVSAFFLRLAWDLFWMPKKPR